METNNETTVLENEKHWEVFGFNDEQSFVEDYTKADDFANDCIYNIHQEILEQIEKINFQEIISKHQNEFKEKYGKYQHPTMTFINESIDSLMSLSCENQETKSNFVGMIEDCVGEAVHDSFL